MEFKVGDKVRRISIGLYKTFANMRVGNIGTVIEVDDYRGCITLKEFRVKPHEVTHSIEMFELVGRKK